jgi:hypothetical protein
VRQGEGVLKTAPKVSFETSERPLGKTFCNVSEGKENVKRKQLVTSLWVLILAAVGYTGSAPLQAQRKPAAKPLITVLNPAIESKMAERLPLSPRLDTLEGKTLYMVDINWGGPEAAYSVFEEIQSWFAQNMPSVKTVIRRKAGSYTTDDPALWKEIVKNSNAALIGISG